MAYSVSDGTFDGEAVCVLADGERRQEAWVLPAVGNNCIRFRIFRAGGAIDTLYPPPDVGALKGRPSGYGIPILFPWPNRIEAGRFTFDGREYRLDAPAAGAHALHGFVLGRPWAEVDRGASDGAGAWVRCRFRSADFPDVARQFPFPFEATATYRLQDGALTLEVEGVNAGEGDMPAGLGMHPYFPLPVAKDGRRAACTVQVPAVRYWPLREDCIPTGEVKPVSGKYDLRQPTPIGERAYDDVWTGVTPSGGWSRCVYEDPAAGVRIAVAGDTAFREWVVYAPPQRPVICFEPYTCVTNAVNLQARGVDAGLVRLKPGEALRGTMRIGITK